MRRQLRPMRVSLLTSIKATDEMYPCRKSASISKRARIQRLHTEHDSKGSPHLPLHSSVNGLARLTHQNYLGDSQSTSDSRGSTLGGIDGGGTRLCTNRQAQHKSTKHKVPPGMRSTHPECSSEGYKAGDEDCSSSTEEVVQRRRSPASDEARAEVRSAVNKSLNPSVCDVEFGEVEPGYC